MIHSTFFGSLTEMHCFDFFSSAADGNRWNQGLGTWVIFKGSISHKRVKYFHKVV